MLLTQQPPTTQSVVYTLDPECYPATLVLDNGQEIRITDEMVKHACRTLERSFYPLQIPAPYGSKVNRPCRKLTLVG
ncbi:MAG: hypothetical protein H6970_07605 [Gammaproteobacteria bacterium]|nr:hypothetical protein [Gammaproteobacteria bacterium]MCP5458105.1 hypothetical protein [Gammaproteobacteria bacterium]